MTEFRPATLDRLMTADDVGAYVGKSADWVKRRAAEFGGMKVGSSWRFDLPGVRRYLDRQRADAAEARQPSDDNDNPFGQTARSRAHSERRRRERSGW